MRGATKSERRKDGWRALERLRTDEFDGASMQVCAIWRVFLRFVEYAIVHLEHKEHNALDEPFRVPSSLVFWLCPAIEVLFAAGE